MTLFLLQWEEGAAGTLDYLIQSDGDVRMNRFIWTQFTAKKKKQTPEIFDVSDDELSHEAFSQILRSLKWQHASEVTPTDQSGRINTGIAAQLCGDAWMDEM